VRLARSIRPARRLLQRVVRRADHYTFVSRWLRDEAAALTPLGEASIAPMPVDVSLFAPPSPGAARRGILFVGRLNAQKGVAELLQALARQRTPAAADIVGDGPDAASVRALADSLGITGRVRWHPAVTQVRLAELYRSAEVLAVPSREEGLGLVAAEAMLCETPVIAFASGGLTDVVADGVNGLLAPTGDIDAFARALDTLIAEPTRARALGTRGRLDVLGRFSPAAVGATYKAIYDSVLARRRA
jgi:glycosyltransferase involved in cell wall biosynthesis